jgi:hypothetical protein
MQLGIALQYFPPDGQSAPVTVHLSTDPDLIALFRERCLKAAVDRRRCSLDPVARLIEGAEEERLHKVLDSLVPERREANR